MKKGRKQAREQDLEKRSKTGLRDGVQMKKMRSGDERKRLDKKRWRRQVREQTEERRRKERRNQGREEGLREGGVRMEESVGKKGRGEEEECEDKQPK